MVYEKYIIRAKKQKETELPAHKSNAPGSRYLFLSKDLLKEANNYIVVRFTKNSKGMKKPHIEPHIHKHNETYLLFGEKTKNSLKMLCCIIKVSFWSIR